MTFPSIADAVLGGPLAGLYANRLNAEQQGEVRQGLTEHLSGLAESAGGEVLLPAEIRIVVAEKSVGATDRAS